MALNKATDKEKNEKKPDQSDLQNQNELLRAQMILYQEQLKQSSDAAESLRLEKEAEKLRLQNVALEEEADLKRTLGEAFPPGTISSNASDDDNDQKPQIGQQQMIQIMGDAVGKAIDANTKLQEAKFAKILETRDDKIDLTQKALIKLMANMSVNEARSDFPDFDKHKEEIGSILDNTQGLSPQDAYLLAKARKTSSQPDPDKLSSERPSTSMSRTTDHLTAPGSDREQQDEYVSPRRQFQANVHAAIEKVLAARTN